jgi:hypothetical protein
MASKSFENSKAGRVLVTAVESNDAKKPIFLFPQGFRFENVNGQDMEKLSSWIQLNDSSDIDVPHSDIGNEALIFVCSHPKRDKRCGVAGPLLIAEFRQNLQAKGISNVAVSAVSHVGGHKFAGNVIIYYKDHRGIWIADWYGRVKTCHVESLIEECIKNKKVIKELWRGQWNGEVSNSAMDW